MSPRALFGDIELDLCLLLRARLPVAAAQLKAPWGAVVVTPHLDFDTPDPWTVVVRDDGGTTASQVTRDHSVATTILGPRDGTDPEGRNTHLLAETVMHLIAGLPEADPVSIIAAVGEQYGPHRILNATPPRPARYATHELTIASTNPGPVIP